MDVKEITIPAKDVQTLVWEGNTLVDWAGGGRRFSLDGSVGGRLINYGSIFDAALTSPSNEYSVIYTRLGTKGLILRNGRLLREINRSYYCADDYEYPVALFALPSGQEVIAHCPEEYCRLEIDDLETGKRLSFSSARKPGDFFHSRLSASASGKYLVSAGWVWHPMDSIHVYDVANGLLNPQHFDGGGLDIDAWAEESSATFLTESKLLVGLDRIERDDTNADRDLPARELRVIDLSMQKKLFSRFPPMKLGTLMAVGESHVLSLYQHPKLIQLENNEIVQEWSRLSTGTQVSSILLSDSKVPPMALDSEHRRIAVASENEIHVLMFK